MNEPGYSQRFIRFVLVPLHREAYESAYLAYDQAAATGELERLHREFMTLPPHHDCSERLGPRGYGAHCPECARIQRSQQTMGSQVVIGRTRPVNPPMPLVLLLDLERAMSVLHNEREIARFLSCGGPAA